MRIHANSLASGRVVLRNVLNHSCAVGALALGFLALPQTAYADDECGPAVGATVTCTSAGNPYPNGITYVAPPQDLTIVLEPDVVVDTTGSLNIGVLGLTIGNTALTIDAGSGASITTGDVNAFGILGATTYGDLSVNTTSVITNGAGADGIFATSSTGEVTVNSGTTYTNGDGARAISAYTNSGNIAVSGFTVVTNGNNAAGFNLQSDGGNIDVTLARGIFGGTILTYGANSSGIEATTGATGNITIVGPGAGGFGSAAVITRGDGSTGVQALAQNGNVLIDLGQVQTTGAGSDAIVATSTGGSVNVNVSTVTADDGRGIVATGATGATVTQSGNFIGTGGDNHAAVTVLASNGPANAMIGTAFTAGANSNAVDVRSTNGSASASTGGITTQGDASVGVLVNGTTGASATVASTRTYGDNADGVNVVSSNGIASVANSGDIRTVGDTSRGIYANGGGGGVTITGTGSVTTGGDFSTGVYATSATGPVAVTTGNVTTAGLASSGIAASGITGPVTVNAGNVSTQGDFSDAVLVTASDGPALADIGNASTNGANSRGVDVSSSNGTATANVGAATTQGAGSAGVFVRGTAGAGATTSSIRTYGAGSDGVDVSSVAGPVTVTNNGDIRTTGVNSGGITAAGPGAIAVGGTGSVITSGNGGSGILATSSGGPVSVTTGVVTTSGANAIAIDARGTSASVTANGIVTRSGAAGAAPLAAINIQGTSGSASANVGNVVGSGTGLSAVNLNGATTASATVGTSGVVTGNVDAIAITSGTGSTVNNAGTLNTGTGYAIRASGGPAAITNTGIVNGRVLLTGGNDTFANSGTFNATQASDFGAGNDAFTNTSTYNSSAVTDLGAGNDSFVNSGVLTANTGGGLNFNTGTDSFANSGIVRILPGTAVAGTTSFTGLESFANSGTIDLRNGHTGDVFNVAGANFVGSGGSTLALDVQLGGTPTADRLVTGAATGSTQVQFVNLTTGVVSLNPGVLLVQGAAGSQAGAFTLAGGPLTYGFATYQIAYNPADFTYRLVGAPSQAAFRTLSMTEGMRNLWYKSADAISSHMTDLRDSARRAEAGTAPAGSGLWFQMYGSTDSRRNVQNFSTFGVNTAANLGYNQDAFGGQIGFDFGTPRPDGGLVFGVTGGYLNSNQSFAASSDRIKYDAVNIGAYANYASGSFFANALAKYDYFWVRSRLAGTDNGDLHGHSYGAQGEVGFRFGGAKFFAEPIVSIAYVRTNLNDLNVPGFAFDFNADEGLRGKAGLRVGSSFEMGASHGALYASGMAVHEFEGRDQVSLTSGGQTLVLRNDRIGTYGHGTIGFNLTTPGGVTGFIEGFGDYGDDYLGGGGRVGLRFRF